MSLITLRSQNSGIPGSVSESAAYIKNFFKEEITFMPGDTFELVSISITKVDKFEIVTGQNDRLVWRIGSGPTTIGGTPKFAQHIVTIPGGGYNGEQLARLLQNLMNDSVILGNFAPDGSGDPTKGGFEVIFTPAVNAPQKADAKFSMTYYQQDTPPVNGETLAVPTINSEFLTNNMNIIQNIAENAYALEVSPAAQSGAVLANFDTLSNSVYGNKSVFPNGGEASVIIHPCKGMLTLSNLPTAIGGSSEIIGFDNGDGTGTHDYQMTFESDATLPNDWEYKVELFDGDTGIITDSQLENHGRIATMTLIQGGNGYNVGDTGDFTGGTGATASYEVTGVAAAGGAVTTFNVTDPGVGYVVGDTLTLDGNFEVGATASVASVLQSAGGTNYQVGDEGTLSATSGSGVGGTYKVLTTDPNTGEILTYEILTGGSGYAAGDFVALFGAGDDNALIRVDDIETGKTDLFGYLTEDGVLALGDSSGGPATNPANWNRGRFVFNVNNNKLASINSGANPGSVDRPKGTIQLQSGAGYTAVLQNVNYPTTKFGVARNQLIEGLTQYPGNANASIYRGDGGFDIQFSVIGNVDEDDIQIKCAGFVKAPGVDYPLPNWRTTKQYIPEQDGDGDEFLSSNWETLPQGPANWATFTFPDDNIKVRMERYGVDKTRIYVSHDDAGDLNFTEEVLVLQQGDDVEGVSFAPNVREIMYPFVPVVFFAKGSRFATTRVDLSGIYDVKRIDASNSVVVGSTYEGNPNDNLVAVHNEEDNYDGQDFTETGLVGGPQGKLQLSSQWKFGLVEPGESSGDAASSYSADGLGGPGINKGDGDPTQMSGRSLNPNFANINNILGFPRWQTFNNNTGTTATLATAPPNVPLTNILEPSLMVEFPDFNIKSFSGESSDTGRAIAVIPREQWTTNEKTGTLIYVAPYPIQIDLGIPNRMTLNEITCRLRQADGLMADDLLHPTEITIRKMEGEEQKQQRMLQNVMNQMNMARANQQDQAISNFNNNMPRI